jgi:hypothetical protein
MPAAMRSWGAVWWNLFTLEVGWEVGWAGGWAAGWGVGARVVGGSGAATVAGCRHTGMGVVSAGLGWAR